jgi:hypothetical protein
MDNFVRNKRPAPWRPKRGMPTAKTEIEWCRAQQRAAMAQPPTVPPFLIRLGVSDLLAEEILIQQESDSVPSPS